MWVLGVNTKINFRKKSGFYDVNKVEGILLLVHNHFAPIGDALNILTSSLVPTYIQLQLLVTYEHTEVR